MDAFLTPNRLIMSKKNSNFDFLLHKIGSKSPASRLIFQNTNDKVERLSLTIHNFLLTLWYLFVIPANLVAIYQYVSSGYSTEHLEQIIPAT